MPTNHQLTGALVGVAAVCCLGSYVVGGAPLVLGLAVAAVAVMTWRVGVASRPRGTWEGPPPGPAGRTGAGGGSRGAPLPGPAAASGCARREVRPAGAPPSGGPARVDAERAGGG
ncbi:hypothetical protein ACFV3R_20520 [Streptomyces sp. NPDC059740]|uniref:hypothetical protein n=1 Tax=Streptomyces sp. NPDC059740 TaxID=3346926 RepID=UPI00364A3877